MGQMEKPMTFVQALPTLTLFVVLALIVVLG